MSCMDATDAQDDGMWTHVILRGRRHSVEQQTLLVENLKQVCPL